MANKPSTGTIVAWVYKDKLQTGAIESTNSATAWIRPIAGRDVPIRVSKPLDELLVVLVPAELARLAVEAARAAVAGAGAGEAPVAPVGPCAVLDAPPAALTAPFAPEAARPEGAPCVVPAAVGPR